MIQIVDLHTHSAASDGQYSPAELVGLAKSRGIEVMALTDHDTIAGVPEAVEAGKSLGVHVIPGVEMSAREYNTFHILGYGVSLTDPNLNAMCGDMKARRNARMERIIAYLGEKGMDISTQEVLDAAGGQIIGRPHFARVMLERGYVSDYRNAFDLYLDTDEYHQRVETSKPTARECVETIKAAGGKVSLAHPYQIGLEDEALEAQVRELVEYGLDAIECFYPKHSERQTAFYLRLAGKYGLRATGGSDFHGEQVKPEIGLAALEMDTEWLLDG